MQRLALLVTSTFSTSGIEYHPILVVCYSDAGNFLIMLLPLLVTTLVLVLIYHVVPYCPIFIGTEQCSGLNPAPGIASSRPRPQH